MNFLVLIFHLFLFLFSQTILTQSVGLRLEWVGKENSPFVLFLSENFLRMKSPKSACPVC